MNKVGQLMMRHEGETAFVFGKGPSLDHFDIDQAGPLRICINESIRSVPRSAYFFAHDELPIRRAAECWQSGCRAILQLPRAELACDCGIADESIYVYDKRQGEGHSTTLTAEQMAARNCLYGNSGTVHSALHFCRLIGASRVELIGFDGAGGYAKCLGLPAGGAQHERIRRDSVNLLEILQIPFEFFGQIETANVTSGRNS